jgi:hypothetical protein
MLKLQLVGTIKQVELYQEEDKPKTIRMKVDPKRDYLGDKVIQWITVIYDKEDATELYERLHKDQTIFASGFPFSKAHKNPGAQAGWVGVLFLFADEIEICSYK